MSTSEGWRQREGGASCFVLHAEEGPVLTGLRLLCPRLMFDDGGVIFGEEGVYLHVLRRLGRIRDDGVSYFGLFVCK